jgi:acetyl-CoA C-acetyltransferase
MRLNENIGVIGTAIHAPRDANQRSLEEAMYAVTRSALLDAGVAIDDIDGIVVAANDQLDGRAISIMMASGSVGGVGRDIVSTPSAAEHAFVLGALRIGSGQFRTQLVVAWSPTEVTSTADALKLGTDPYFHRALPLDELTASALQAVALESTVPGLREIAVNIVAKNRAHGVLAYPDRAPAPVESAWIAGGKLKCWPLTQGMVSPPAYGLVALVLADQRFIAERKLGAPAWIQGMGWATEPSFLGDRELAQMPSLVQAARQAYGAAGIEDAAAAFQVAELSDATPYQELIAYEALGLCARERWAAAAHDGRFARGGALPVNLSGGALSFNPIYCAGLVSIAEAANQVRGRAGHHQAQRVTRALAHAASGFAMQYNTVVVLGAACEEMQQ